MNIGSFLTANAGMASPLDLCLEREMLRYGWPL